MYLPIGFQLYGKAREFSNQYLITEFFILGIPVWPMSSYFINQETGLKLKIPLSSESLKSFYLGGGLIWFGAILFGSSFMIASLLTKFNVPYVEVAPFVLSLVVLSVGGYHYFIRAKPTKTEIKKRTVLQMATGLNALPGWLGPDEARKMHEVLLTNFDSNWKQLIRQRTYAQADFYKLYGLITYETYLSPTRENGLLQDSMEKIFIKNDPTARVI